MFCSRDLAHACLKILIVAFFSSSGNAGDRDGHLQDGGLGHEDAGGRVDAGEEDGQDFPADGQEHGRKIIPRRIYRRRQK